MEEKKLDSLLRILEFSIRLETVNEKKRNTEINNIMKLSVISSIIFLSLMIIFLFFKLKLFALIMLILIYLVWIIYPFLLIFINRKSLIGFFYNPMTLIFRQMKINTKTDRKLINHFSKKSLDDIKLIKTLIDVEYNEFIHRISNVIGSISKLGLFPGVLALLVTINKIEELSDIMYSLVFAIGILYFLCSVMNISLLRLQRISGLLDYIIEKKESELNNKD